MYALVAVKFRDRHLRKRLLDTGESEFMEWVKSKEGFWGALTYDGRAGQNMLGQILMRLREFIRTHQTAKVNHADALLFTRLQPGTWRSAQQQCTGRHSTAIAKTLHAVQRATRQAKLRNTTTIAKTSRAVQRATSQAKLCNNSRQEDYIKAGVLGRTLQLF